MLLVYLSAFFLAFVASFLGSLPFGTVNLNVVETTIRKNFQAAVFMALAGALIEILHSFLAVHCSMFISRKLEDSLLVNLTVLGIFLSLGIYFFLQKPKTTCKEPRYKVPDFVRAAVLSLLNPQALPFWVFVTTWYTSHNLLNLETKDYIQVVISFLLGVSAGKFLALVLFGALSTLIKKRASFLSAWMNKIIGSIFFVLAAVQGIKMLV